MARTTLIAALAASLWTSAALADCVATDLGVDPGELTVAAPAPIDMALKPQIPACLQNLASPEQESCPRDELAAYGEAVTAWAEALNTFVTETNAYANAAADFANEAVDHALRARAHADAALAFAECEAAEINAAAE